jgi:hypothetical protein
VNNAPHLDSFETALLAELRREVAEHPAPVPAPLRRSRRPRRRLRLAAVGATGIAASVVAVFGLGGTGGSPAYAVDENSAGDVIVTVHRLDDAAGLEKALAAKGIDADVSYDADGSTGQFSVGSPDGIGGELPPPPAQEQEQGTLTQEADGAGPSHVRSGGEHGDGSGPASVGPAAPDDLCGPAGTPPATLTHDGSDWVLTIPAGSPLHDRHVDIGTDASGALAVQYAGKEPGSYCGVMSMGAPGTP